MSKRAGLLVGEVAVLHVPPLHLAFLVVEVAVLHVFPLRDETRHESYG